MRKLELYSEHDKIGSNSCKILTRTLFLSTTSLDGARSIKFGKLTDLFVTFNEAGDWLEGKTRGGGVIFWFLGGNAGTCVKFIFTK